MNIFNSFKPKRTKLFIINTTKQLSLAIISKSKLSLKVCIIMKCIIAYLIETENLFILFYKII